MDHLTEIKEVVEKTLSYSVSPKYFFCGYCNILIKEFPFLICGKCFTAVYCSVDCKENGCVTSGNGKCNHKNINS